MRQNMPTYSTPARPMMGAPGPQQGQMGAQQGMAPDPQRLASALAGMR